MNENPEIKTFFSSIKCFNDQKNNKESNNENMHVDSKIETFSFSKCHKRNYYSLFLQFVKRKNVNKGSVGNIAKDMRAFYINKTNDNIITMNVLNLSLYGPVRLCPLYYFNDNHIIWRSFL